MHEESASYIGYAGIVILACVVSYICAACLVLYINICQYIYIAIAI